MLLPWLVASMPWQTSTPPPLLILHAQPHWPLLSCRPTAYPTRQYYLKIARMHLTQRTNKHPHKTRPVQAYVKNTHLKALCHTHITIACYDMILLTFFQRPLFMKIVFACRAFELKRFGAEQMRRRQLLPLLWTFRSRRIVSTTFCFEKMSIWFSSSVHRFTIHKSLSKH